MNSGEAEQVKSDNGANDIDNGIEGTHFVEVDLIDRCAVNFGLGCSQSSEDSQGLF